MLDKNGGFGEEVNARINKALYTLENIWAFDKLYKKDGGIQFDTNVKRVISYAYQYKNCTENSNYCK